MLGTEKIVPHSAPHDGEGTQGKRGLITNTKPSFCASSDSLVTFACSLS